MSGADGLAAFVDRHGDRAAEIVWWGALAILERAALDAREPKWARWRYYPRGELRRLRRDVARALELAHLAVALQEEDNEQQRELDEELQRQAEEEGRRRRRAQTMRAQEVRLENARRRREQRS